jgi:hypothetical protein
MHPLTDLLTRLRTVTVVAAAGLLFTACADGEIMAPLGVEEMTPSFSETVETTSSSTMFEPFTQIELDTNWEADRRFPTGGVSSVSEFGRDDVARIGIDTDQASTSEFHRTEGIKTLGDNDFGLAVQVDLYIDPAWQGNATRGGALGGGGRWG